MSFKTAVTLSSLAFLSGLARLVLEVRYVPEVMNAMPEDQPGQAGLVLLFIVAFFGGWLGALMAAANHRRAGLIATLIFNLILAFPWGLATIVVYCPTPCAVAWPIQELVTWSNVIAGIGAAVAAGLALSSKLQPASA